MSKSQKIKLIEDFDAPSREVAEHVQEVNERNIEFACRKKEQIELEELKYKRWLYYKTVETVWQMQQGNKGKILRLQMAYEKNTLLQSREKQELQRWSMDMQKLFGCNRNK
ncbi:hypothetical protein TNIN_270221 [Trichonephila inaurata madagascariensis]|uniref:Uncharacterized protein n=1 Tax=Trichonephila inaurata madagascariensis TaxID=2747483 RepID=A0A8X6X4X8_9ARAC|nr:hypothetical protein TNIN_270221 [Trichonephila inaurata madagascariensis]